MMEKGPWNDPSLLEFRCDGCGYTIFPLPGMKPPAPVCPECGREMEELFRIDDPREDKE